MMPARFVILFPYLFFINYIFVSCIFRKRFSQSLTQRKCRLPRMNLTLILLGRYPHHRQHRHLRHLLLPHQLSTPRQHILIMFPKGSTPITTRSATSPLLS